MLLSKCQCSWGIGCCMECDCWSRVWTRNHREYNPKCSFHHNQWARRVYVARFHFDETHSIIQSFNNFIKFFMDSTYSHFQCHSYFCMDYLFRHLHSVCGSPYLLQQSNYSKTSDWKGWSTSCSNSIIHLFPVHAFLLMLLLFIRSMSLPTCSICLEDFVEGEKISVLPCKHSFHYKCIVPWLGSKNSCCPICKDCPYRGHDVVGVINEDIDVIIDDGKEGRSYG